MSSGPLPNQVNVYQDTPNQVIIDQDAENRVIVRSISAAANTRRHVHSQASPQTTWTIRGAQNRLIRARFLRLTLVSCLSSCACGK